MKTPYFQFNKSKLEENFNNFQNICKKNFDEFEIYYSTKTNSNSEVIKTLKKLKSNFEIASLKEMNLTPKESKKIFNGPAKTLEELKEAIKNKIFIYVDSFSELEKIISLKVNPKIGIRFQNKKSKFGFSSRQLEKAFEICEKNKIKIVSFQLHSGTLKNLNEFKKNLKEIKKVVNPYLEKIESLNFGGGYPDNFQLKNRSINLENYFKEIKNNFKDFNGTFIFEPGRFLVSDAYTLITKVISIKEKDELNYTFLDAGINILPKITLANYEFRKVNEKKNEKKQEYLLVGPLLFENDILAKFNGNLKEGDLIEVHNVGAYCIPLSWEIIYDKPKVKII